MAQETRNIFIGPRGGLAPPVKLLLDGLQSSEANCASCMSNNAAEREIRPIAVGRKNWTFAGSDEGGRRAAVIYTLIQTAKLNDVDPQAWLPDVLACINDHTIHRLGKLLPWNWAAEMERRKVAA
jgi:IS66 C-terminal element/Transposase IS66 family